MLTLWKKQTKETLIFYLIYFLKKRDFLYRVELLLNYSPVFEYNKTA